MPMHSQAAKQVLLLISLCFPCASHCNIFDKGGGVFYEGSTTYVHIWEVFK